jgi:hypothetical protein
MHYELREQIASLHYMEELHVMHIPLTQVFEAQSASREQLYASQNGLVTLLH